MQSYLLFHVCVIGYVLGYVFGGSIPATLEIPGGIHKALFTSIPATSIIDHRVKRQNYDFCPVSCSLTMKGRMDTLLPGLANALDRTNDPYSTPSMTREQFRIFCKDVYEPFVDCTDECDPSSTIDTIKLTLAAVDYMCFTRYDDYYQNLPCLKKIQNETISQCINNLCEDYKDAPQKLTDAASMIRYTQDYTNLKRLLANNCKLVKCLVPCEGDIMKRRCGESIADAYKNLVKLQLESSRQLFKKIGVSWIWPRECQFNIV